MQWLLKRDVVIAVTHDARAYSVKWRDKAYLQNVRGLGGNEIFISECMEALRLMRDAADVAKTPQELDGANKCIAIFKGFMAGPVEARRRLENAIKEG